jgi:DNA modification methylase
MAVWGVSIAAHELIFLFKNGSASHRNNVQLGKFGRYRTNVWNYPSANTFSPSGPDGNLLALHPTPKPVALIADAIKDSTARGALALDPFLGSGLLPLRLSELDEFAIAWNSIHFM